VFFTINFQAFNPVSVRRGSVNYINLTKGPASELSAHTWSAANSLKHQYKSALKKTGYSCLPKSIKFTVLFARRFAFDFSYSIFSEI